MHAEELALGRDHARGREHRRRLSTRAAARDGRDARRSRRGRGRGRLPRRPPTGRGPAALCPGQSPGVVRRTNGARVAGSDAARDGGWARARFPARRRASNRAAPSTATGCGQPGSPQGSASRWHLPSSRSSPASRSPASSTRAEGVAPRSGGSRGRSCPSASPPTSSSTCAGAAGSSTAAPRGSPIRPSRSSSYRCS